MQRLKQLLGLTILLLAGVALMELLSVGLLLTVAKPGGDHFKEPYRLMERFPAQLRMSGAELRAEFPRSLPMMRTGGYLTFPFDPVLGFRVTDNLEWYGGSLEERSGKFFIVTFGGSSTIADNWPRYLRRYAERQGVAEDLLVLNAGHMGYMSFNEKQYFSDWIMPMLEQAGVKPDLVLALDGANDVYSRIVGWLESQRQNAPIWFSHYHGYHQHLDTDMRTIAATGSVLRQVTAVLARESYDFAVNRAALVIPYTMKAVLTLLRKTLQRPPSREEFQQLQDRPVMTLPEGVESQIVSGYRATLLDFYGAVTARGIGFVDYLQPVFLEKYYPRPATEDFFFPSANHFALNIRRVARHFTRLGGDSVIRIEGVFEKAERMYETLDRQHRGAFTNIIGVLHDLPDVRRVYHRDALHYEHDAKERIADVVIRDLLAKGILTRRRAASAIE